MPLYEFQCKGCGHEFEDLVLGSAQPVCPSCNSRQLERLLSVFAVSAGRGRSHAGRGCVRKLRRPQGTRSLLDELTVRAKRMGGKMRRTSLPARLPQPWPATRSSCVGVTLCQPKAKMSPLSKAKMSP